MSTSIKLNKVVKRYGAIEVVHGIDLTIDPGEFTVFVGPSGCGKSTLLRMIAGLEPISGGELLIDGERMNEVPASKRGIAMVFQSYALYPHMTVYKNLAFGLETAGYKRAEVEERVQKAAKILKIDTYLQRRPKALSGGQRQRVAIGRAIVREPKIFLFDEPLSNLDAELRVQMRVEIAKLHQDLGNTMIYVTHDQVEAMTMADKIVVLNKGHVEQVGRPLDLYHHPRNLFVAGFIGSPSMNFLPGKIAGLSETGVEVALGGGQKALVRCKPDARAAKGAPVTLGLRPEDLKPNAPGDSAIPGKVRMVERLGGDTYLYLNTQEGADITVHAPGDIVVAAGDQIPIGVSAAKSHLFHESGEAFARFPA
ncbi:ABC transporter ATP-binding protein [Hypericibacter sp.]|uniref:ABC transporter ATP-binding protein n=1 Tax=Hypericibacter sp. TaxID=2705401 RepID=UPI003D6D9902